MNRKKERLVAVLSFMACLLVLTGILYQTETMKRRELRSRTQYVTASQVAQLQYVLNTLFLKTQTLEILIMEGGGRISNFDETAEKLCDNTAIRSLQLAPDGVVTQVYPLRGNEDAFGDLFSDPDRRTEAIAARDTGQMTLSGPFELYQGGLGVVARRPVYLKNSDGEREFWGFTIIVLDLPDAFYPAKLDEFMKSGFEYKLYRVNPDTQQIQIIDESSSAKLESPEVISFEVPNGTWYFGVMPRKGWLDASALLAEIITALLISGMFVLSMDFVNRQKNQKKLYYNLAVTDQLTGLNNYSSLMERLADNYGKQREMYLFYMDLNCFKGINDTYGHDAGNQVLVETAARLKECFGKEGQVFRNGGDEFCAVVADAYRKDYGPDMERIIEERFAKPFKIDAGEIFCSVSVGYAHYPTECQDVEALLRQADERMYERKAECAAKRRK